MARVRTERETGAGEARRVWAGATGAETLVLDWTDNEVLVAAAVKRAMGWVMRERETTALAEVAA
jgi:hypothetical protein